MKKILFAALLMASPATAQVGHRCVENCGDDAPPQSAPARSAPAEPSNPMGDAMMNGLKDGLNQGIQNWQQKQRDDDLAHEQYQRQHNAEVEKERKQNENEQHNELQSEMMTGVDTVKPTNVQPTKVESLTTHPRSLAVPKLGEKILRETAVDRQIKGLNCMLERFFAITKEMGASGAEKAEGLRQRINSIRGDLLNPSESAHGIQSTTDSFDFKSQEGHIDRQMVGRMTVTSDFSTGQVNFDVLYQSDVGKKVEEGQSILHFDKDGNLLDKDAPAAVRKCLKKSR